MKYISRGINLDEEVWAAFQKLREVHGSYNKALRALLPGEPEERIGHESNPLRSGDCFTSESKIVSPLVDLSRANRKPLLKPKERK